MRIRPILIVLTVLLLLVAVGCSGGQQEPAGGEQAGQEPAAPQETFKIGAVFQHPTMDFYVPHRIGAYDAAKKYGMELEFMGPHDSDSQKQINMIESLLAAGVQGLVIQNSDPTVLKPVVDKAVSMGVPVISTNNIYEMPGVDYAGYCGADGEVIGKQMGMQLEAILKGEGPYAELHGIEPGEVAGKVAYLIDMPGAANLESRIKGARDYLSQFPGIIDVGKYDATISINKGQEVVDNIITANPDLRAIISVCSSPTPAAANVIKDRGLEGQVILIGMDLLPQALMYLKEGIVANVIGQNPYQQGYLPVEALYEYLANGKPIPKFMQTDLEIVDLTNVDEILERETDFLKKGTLLEVKGE